MMKKILINFFVFSMFVAGLFPKVSHGHARFMLSGSTPPRTNALGLKGGPCGGAARTTNPTILQAGQTLQVQWEETINHPGYYRIAFSPAGDVGFDQNILIPSVPDNTNTGSYAATITVPDVPCTNCTLQMIQYMTEATPPTLYYSCADINIVAAGSPVPSPTPRASFAPGPVPTACH